MTRISLGLMACSASPIHVGQATRQEVRRLLGTPIFEDPSWGIDLYRSGHTDMSTEWLAAPVPFPGWVNVIEYRLYPVIVYASSEVVEGVGAGRYWEDNVEVGTNRPRGTGAARARPLRDQPPESRAGCQGRPG